MNTIRLPGARAVFTTRRGGVSDGPYESLNLGILTDDRPERIGENRLRVARDVGVEPAEVAMGWQVHGKELREWDGPPDAEVAGYSRPGAELPRVDGHLTSTPGIALLVLVADCVPVALAGGGTVAMLHCGWRGLAEGIVEKALDRFPQVPAAAVGPAIGPCCYEVGEEVLGRFADLDGVADGRMLDLRAIVERKLRDGGVRDIGHVDHCTSCRAELYFSHRRDDGVTGRQAGLVVLE